MKRIVSVLIVCVLVIALVGCDGSSNGHEGEAKTPSASSVQKGRNYQDVVGDFEKKGFTNIKTEVLDDLITGWLTKDGEVESVSVDGNKDYKADVWYPNGVEVMVTYHTFAKDEEKPESATPKGEEKSDSTTVSPTEQEASQQDNNDEAAKEALESSFPVENAKRAAVVAITNCTATDVFAEDGNTYDVSKFHSYADVSGNFFNYFINVNSWGAWSAKDERTWHVDSLIYENSWGNAFNAFLDVNYDGTNYIVSNITTTFGKPDDPSKSGEDNYSFIFTIHPELIKDDRSQTKIDSYHKWEIDQFSSLDGSHKELKTLIINNLNDEKSFKHIETTYQKIWNEEIRDEINEILKSSNKEARVEIGDLWITTQFSAKNAFNATIKNTAYGIASFSNNTIVLVAIE